MEIVLSVSAKVAEHLVAPIIHPFTYCCSYKTNFEKLKNEVDKLKIARDSVQHKVDDSIIKGDGIQQHVEEWLTSVNKAINEVRNLIEDGDKSNNRCLKGLCPNLKTRYHLSKKAETEAKAIVGLLQKERLFDAVSFRTIPEEPWLNSTQGGFMHFESRNSTLKKILDALGNRNFNMIGVYGMGGIGKTTLVQEVGRQAKENNLFDKVISAQVSQTPQIKHIQEEIADKIGLRLDEQTETVRAGRLLERLKKEKKILIILDDIWERLDLGTIGIPSADDNSGCKVLLTARSEEVVSSKMDCKPYFFVDVLNAEEAWSLFTKTTGECIENGEMRSVATEIVKECAGLPIAIVPVARALRNKGSFAWEDALVKLRRPSFENVGGTQEVAYKSIELSYNHLNGEELKSTFLLIGYSSISCVEDVRRHGMGLGLFQKINTLEEARNRALTLVDELKNSCLLLDGDTSERFSMHDVVRDTAISIASRDHHVFVSQNEVVTQINWPEKERLKVCSAISVIKLWSEACWTESKTDELPLGLECPQLKYFRTVYYPSMGIPDNFFTGMTELRVLDFTNMYLRPLPSLLGLLQNLQTLSLDDCKLGDIAIVGDLKKLQILSLQGSKMEELVAEIGQLAQLRLLDLSRCFELKIIPPNVISSLSRLEELYIGESPIEWGKVEGVKCERRNASLDELNHLSKLTSVEILVQDVKTLPRDLSFFKRLRRYRIFIGNRWWDLQLHGISRKFKLRITDGANICLNEGHIMQLKGIEDLSLDGLLDVKNVLYELAREGVPQLKRLEIQDNSNLFCVVDTVDCATTWTAFPLLESLFLEDLSSLEKICRGPLTAESFCKLKYIWVQRCNKLKDIFPLVIARGLQQLQWIEVSSCQNMEVIFTAERGDDESSNNNNTQPIELTQLRKLKLQSLPQLTSFCAGDLHFEFPSLKQLTIQVFNNLEKLTIYGCNNLINLVPSSTSFQNLTALTVFKCNGMMNVLTSSTAKSLVQLRKMSVSRCNMITEIVADDESSNNNNTQVIELTQLRTLELRSLPQLTSFCTGDLHFEFPSLKRLTIEGCPAVKFKSSTIHGFSKKVLPNLEELSVDEKHIHLFPEDLLCKLKQLDVSLDESATISSLHDFLHILCTIKILFITGGSDTHLGSSDKVENGVKTLIQGINKRPDLKQIFKQESSITNDLEKLSIWSCDNLINLAPSSTSFQNLTALTVVECNGMMNVLTSSTAKSLVRLRGMFICGCKMIREIVTDDDGVGDNYAAKDEIVFSELKELELSNLESLTSFYSGNHCAFKFPSLKKIVLEDCPNMNIFSGGELSTPKLHTVQLQRWDGGERRTWDRDLNSTIQCLYLKKKEENKNKNETSANANEKEEDAKKSG